MGRAAHFQRAVKQLDGRRLDTIFLQVYRNKRCLRLDLFFPYKVPIDRLIDKKRTDQSCLHAKEIFDLHRMVQPSCDQRGALWIAHRIPHQARAGEDNRMVEEKQSMEPLLCRGTELLMDELIFGNKYARKDGENDIK